MSKEELASGGVSHLIEQVVDHIPSMLAYWDKDLRCRFANQPYSVWFGVDPSALVGKSIRELLGPSLFALNEPYILGALRGEPQAFERVIRGGDGIERNSLAYYTPHIVDGEVRGFVAYVTEVTKLKRVEATLNATIRELESEVERRRTAEQTLADVEQSLAVALDSVGAGFISTDRQGRVTRMNGAAERITGWTKDAAVGRSLWEVFVREDREAGLLERNPVDVALERGTTLETRHAVVAVARDGTRTALEVQATMTPDEEGAIRGVAMVFRDVTRLNEAELALRRLAAIVDGSTDAIIGTDLQGHVTDWNAAAARTFGYTAPEVIGKHVDFLAPASAREEQGRALSSVARGVPVPPYDTIRLRKDGSPVDVAMSFSPIQDALGNVVGISKSARDITESKRRDVELRRSNAELEQFAYVASHDLQEPLRMVVNYTELLWQRYGDKLDERAAKYIHFAVDGARRMQNLVSALLDYSRVGSASRSLSRVSASAVARAVVASLDRLIKENDATVEVTIDPRLEILADETQLGQLIQNLVANAVKFRSDAAPQVVVASSLRDGRACLSVSDNGIGLDMKYAPRLFQMFQRLHEMGKYPGSGIGLAIAKRIVERHGGSIWVESEVGKGSTFFATFALAVPPGPILER